MSKILGIIIGLLILSLMLFLHELGHFLIGRALGFKVVEFSIFMGPRLLTWERNGINYSLKLIPLGASVEFAGEYSEDDVKEEKTEADIKQARAEGNFFAMPIWKRALTMLAGPLMNLITASLAFIILFSITSFRTTKIANVSNDSLAEAAGVSAGERVVELADYDVNTDLDMTIASLLMNQTEPYSLKTIDADGNTQSYTIKPEKTITYKLGITMNFADGNISIAQTNTDINPDANKFVLGDQIKKVNGKSITPEEISAGALSDINSEPIKFTVLRGDDLVDLEVTPAAIEVPKTLGLELKVNEDGSKILPYSFAYQWSYVKGTAKVIGQIFTGSMKASDSLTGPVGIVDTFNKVVTSKQLTIGPKLLSLLSLFATISLALGATNLLPIPPLDGGQLFLLLIEKIRGKRLSIKAENIITILGILFVLLLFVVALTADIGRIFR